jgi:hypothetical protein
MKIKFLLAEWLERVPFQCIHTLDGPEKFKGKGTLDFFLILGQFNRHSNAKFFAFFTNLRAVLPDNRTFDPTNPPDHPK